MDPLPTFCPNLDCPARGQIGKGNIGILSRKEKRYACRVCSTTFSARKGTPLYRCHTDPEEVVRVVTLVQHGCPIAAIQAAFGFQRRTIRGWVKQAGAHCEAIHHHLVVQPRDLVQVQADEIRVKTQRGIQWIAMALAVPTRLWLGAVMSPVRDKKLIGALVALVRCCTLPAPLLFAVDGFSAYVLQVAAAFRAAVKVHHFGRPRLVAWDSLVIGQVIKRQQKRRLVEVVRKLVRGTEQQLKGLVAASQGAGVLNTSLIERLNATFRCRLFYLVRKTRCLARNAASLHWGLYLTGTLYNFCTFHDSLTPAKAKKQTPAMAAGITDHCWSIIELLCFHVPPERWQPPKRRGRRSKALQALVERWAT